MKRLKIFYQYSTCKFLPATKGDFINEINTMKALSRFADVYYSGFKFEPDAPGYGMNSYSHDINYRPEDYDVVYVRANMNVLMKAVRAGVKTIWMASPYNRQAFEYANIIAAFSEKWAKLLNSGVFVPGLNPDKIKWNNAVACHQTVGDEFKPLQTHEKTKKIREFIGRKYIIGCFGRVVKSNYPHLLLSILPELLKAEPDLKIVFGVTASTMLPKNLPNNVLFTNFSYADMPYALSACDLTVVSSQGHEWDFCGSLKTIESAACGVPVICGESAARRELFGKEYSMILPAHFFEPPITPEKQKSLLLMILLYLSNEIAFDINLPDEIVYEASFYNVDNSAKRWENIINKLCQC